MGNRISSHTRMKKRLIQHKFHKLNDRELQDAYYLLKPDLTFSSVINHTQEYEEESLLTSFLGNDRKYFYKITKKPITPEMLNQIYIGICIEMEKRSREKEDQ